MLVRSPSHGLRTSGSNGSRKLGGDCYCPVGKRKAVHRQGHGGISTQLASAAAGPGTRISTPLPTCIPLLPSLPLSFTWGWTISSRTDNRLWVVYGSFVPYRSVFNLSHPTQAPFSLLAFVKKMGQSPTALWGGWPGAGFLLPIDLHCFCQLPEWVCRTLWGSVWLWIMK